MTDRQICFILCVSDALYQEECLTYLRALEVPEGYSIDVITVEGAESVCAGYNAAMRASDAKYKIYLRQETFIRDRHFLLKMLKIFDDRQIGMIGMVGAKMISEDGVLQNGQREGAFTALEMTDESSMYIPDVLQEGICDVRAVDDRLIATQVDLPWREDLFADSLFAVMAQAMEFQEAGYRVVVTAQQPVAWYLYDTTIRQITVSEQERERFLAEYGSRIYEADRPKKRILYPDRRTINIPWALTLVGMEVVRTEFCGTPERKRTKDIDLVSRQIRELHVDAVMTHDYMAPIAVACEENHVPYIAWVYDSLQIALYDASVCLPMNYIFDFDRIQAEETRTRGAVYVRHMPLAANVHSMDQLEISRADEQRYACDISFIGSLYSQSMYQLPMEKLRASAAAEIRRLMADQIGRWEGEIRFFGRLSEQTITEIASFLDEKKIFDISIIGRRSYIEQAFFSRGVSHLERVEALRRLARPGWDVRLYTREGEKKDDLPGVRIGGWLEYNTELPKAYYLSKINLNLTLPSIRSGVPLRVFDIMGAGGFLLTNYQPEMEELFVIGQELEVFHSFDEMEDKADYYLRHEEKRLRIARNGHRKVRERYSYEKMVGRILDMVSEDLEQKGRPGLR